MLFTTVSRFRTTARTSSRGRSFGWTTCAVLALMAFGAGTAPLGAESLKAAVDMALSHDATVHSAATDVQAARLDAAAAARSVLPALDLGASYRYTTASADLTLPIPGQPQTISLVRQNTIDTSVGFQWAPFTGFARQSSIELKRLTALLAENSLSSTRTRVALETVTAFRQAQSAQLQIDSISSGRERAQLQLDRTTALQKQGMAKEVDVLSLTIARLDFDQKLIAAKAALRDALEQLKSLTGAEISVPEAPTTEKTMTLPSLSIESLDQIKALSIRRTVLQTNRKREESKYYPSLALSGALHYGIPGADPVTNDWMLYGTAGISLSWSYDWGATSLAVRAATQRIAKLASDETAAREKINLQFAKAVRDWHAMKEEADVLNASLNLARTRMNIVRSQNEQGMASTTDFNDANLQLTVAELRYRSQILSLMLKANQIDALSGEPIDQWSIAQ